MHALYDEKKILEYKSRRNNDLYAWLDEASEDNQRSKSGHGTEVYHLKDLNFTGDEWMSEESDIELDNLTNTQSQVLKSKTSKPQNTETDSK